VVSKKGEWAEEEHGAGSSQSREELVNRTCRSVFGTEKWFWLVGKNSKNSNFLPKNGKMGKLTKKRQNSRM
jgi:hypothetical protein